MEHRWRRGYRVRGPGGRGVLHTTPAASSTLRLLYELLRCAGFVVRKKKLLPTEEKSAGPCRHRSTSRQSSPRRMCATIRFLTRGRSQGGYPARARAFLSFRTSHRCPGGTPASTTRYNNSPLPSGISEKNFLRWEELNFSTVRVTFTLKN